nr:YceD family protein [Thiorhodovibrio winogradskyi]
MYSLHFARDVARRPVVHVAARGLLRLTCQRCLGIMDWRLDEYSVLALVQGFDEAGRLPDNYDPLLLEEPLLQPLKLIEDEILLAIPAIPRHPRCNAPDSPLTGPPKSLDLAPLMPNRAHSGLPLAEDRAESAQASSQDASPFAVLADWNASRD